MDMQNLSPADEAIRQKLWETFDRIDVDNNGSIEPTELGNALELLGLHHVDKSMIEEMLKTVDLDRDQRVEFSEFYKVFHELDAFDERVILNYWLKMAQVDNGSDFKIPVPAHTGELFTFFTAGAVGGGISRSFTAPLERLKIIAQTQKEKKSWFNNLRTVFQNEGLAGFFKGNAISIVRASFCTGLVCTLYANFVQEMERRSKHTRDELNFKKYSTTWKAMAGFSAGVTATIITYPLDVVHTHVCSDAYKGRSDLRLVFKDIMKTGGSMGLFRGLLPTVLAIGPFVAIDKTIYNSVKEWRAEHGQVPRTTTFLACSTTSAFIATTMTYPIDVIRRQCQMSKNPINVYGATKSIITKDGPRGLFRGVGSAYMKVIPSLALSYTAIETTLRFLHRKKK
mmetsp:Transcript_9746/g.10796  ORF Transcript_9746/g.10796 Transcript_9746/m.10796 type:complete len:397 (-) Transcript_9746:81-1271(-)